MHTRLFIAAALAGAAGVTVAALVPWTVSGTPAGEGFDAQVAALSGLDTARHGAVRFTALPVPRLEVSDVVLEDKKGGVSLSAESLRSTVRLLPLLSGRIEITEVTLVRPQIEVASDDEASAAPIVRASATAGASDAAVTQADPPPAPRRAAAPGERGQELLLRIARMMGGASGNGQAGPDLRRLKIAGGMVTLCSSDGVMRTVFDKVDATFTRARLSDVVEATASLEWRGDRVTIEGTSRPAALIEPGESAPVSLRVVADKATLNLEGTLSGGAEPQIDGSLVVHSADIAALASWVGTTLPLPVAGSLDLSATAKMRPAAMELSPVKLTLGAGQFDGALSMKPGEGGMTVSGTLATDQLDLTEGLRPLAPGRGFDGGWSRDAFATEALPRGDLDLRVSAARLLVGGATLDNAAFSVMAHGGRIDVALGDADFYRGTLRGRASAIADGRGSYDVKAQVGFDKVDAGLTLAALGAGKRLTGIASGTVAVEGAGDAPATLLRSLEGKAALTMRQGEVVGINLPELLKRVERRPLLAALDARGGRTPYTSAVVSGRIKSGTLDLADATMVSPAAKVVLTGQVGFGERMLAIQGSAQAATATVAGADPVTLPFELTGSFDEPLLLPDAKSLIKRSGAAAPFFGDGARPADPRTAAGAAPALLPQ